MLKFFVSFQEETEWQHYLRASIETIVRVSEILPDEVLRIVDQAWDETSNVYLRVIRDFCMKFHPKCVEVYF